ncbi:unnamed protein product [Polarella glacialis]|uniref:Berberine/berberine-like domain-containing protein n=1 Tax=Polarella glacialis TaxID=89957 RepID=A0A813KF20_POLGL|nr:unnamed protein product [Polarella glacialis]CAE8702806.1 unnamed protein product [Polarella glacialis]
MVMHDGRVLTVNAKENEDLFWGLPGAGANFGIATRFKFKLTKVARNVLAGDVVRFPKGEGPPIFNSGKTRFELIKQWTGFYATAPDECSALLVLAGQGPVVARIAYIPKEEADCGGDDVEEVTTPTTSSLRGCWGRAEPSSIKLGRAAFQPIMSSATALINTVKPRNYWNGLQKMGQFKSSFYYQKGVNVEGAIPDDVLQKLTDLAKECPVSNDGSAIILMTMGGKLKELRPGDGPSSDVMGRMNWWVLIIAQFPQGAEKPELRQRCIDWVRKTYEVVKPLGFFGSLPKPSKNDNDNGGALHSDEATEYWTTVIGELYGSNWPRLRELKRKYDPENFFSLNRNIKPAEDCA